jgi:phosphatidylserine/phosphatidylglycerophosphate/cardiolipin synthase-like enzyme
MDSRTVSLAIEVKSPHHRPVHGASVRLVGSGEVLSRGETAQGVYLASLPEVGSYSLVIERSRDPEGFDHHPFQVTLLYARRGGAASVVAGPQPAGALPRLQGIRQEGGVFRVEVILEYRWFTSIGAPPTLGNRVEVLIGGEAAFRAVARAVSEARESVHLTTWKYEPDAELLRPTPLAEPAARAPLTVHHLLTARAKAGVTIRMLLWAAPLLPWVPRRARRAAEAAGDRFEVLEEPNPTRRPLRAVGMRLSRQRFRGFRVGSYHQKTIVVDGKIGFCGGMNLREVDWDAREHRVFDPRRCAFSRPASFREEVAKGLRLPDFPPRHDVLARLEGPSLPHLQENFRERWNHLLARRARYAAQASPVEPPLPGLAAGPSQVQVVRTMPAPRAERGLLDVYRRAIASARRLIYIEDQFFHSTLLSDALARALRENPALTLVVVTIERRANSLFFGGWSRESFERLALERPDLELYALKAAGLDGRNRATLVEVFTHAKLLLVDDVFMLIGSGNVNDRSLEVDGELDLAVVDPDLVRRHRVDLWRGHLGGDPRVTGELDADLAVWKEHAERNRGYEPGGGGALPESFVFPFLPRGRCPAFLGRDVV